MNARKAGQFVGGVIVLCLLMCWTNESLGLAMPLLLVAWAILVIFFLSLLDFRRGAYVAFIYVYLILPLSFAALVGLQIVHLQVHRWYLSNYPPPRPMFCDGYGDHERALLPYWHVNVGDVDQFGHWMWVDVTDNCVLIVATGVAKASRFGALGIGMEECQVRVGDDRHDHFVTLKRGQDRLVIVLPDGRIRQFAIEAGQARQFEELISERGRAGLPFNILREARSLAKDPTALDDFLEGYTEPTEPSEEAPPPRES